MNSKNSNHTFHNSFLVIQKMRSNADFKVEVLYNVGI